MASRLRNRRKNLHIVESEESKEEEKEARQVEKENEQVKILYERKPQKPKVEILNVSIIDNNNFVQLHKFYDSY